jgi:DNA-binding CsgD family transcriptional regulator
VLVLVLDGRATSDIARERGRSTRTIANQIASIFRKVSVRSRGELVAWLTGTP